MVTIREILGLKTETDEVEEPRPVPRPKPRSESRDLVDKAIIILGKNCPSCKELLESSAFKEFYKAAYDKLAIVFDEEGYVFGADYSNLANLLERRAGIETPAFAVSDDVDMLENNPSLLLKIARLLGIQLMVKRRSRSSESSRSKRRKGTGKVNEFVESKKLKREIKKALSGCLGDVCREV